MDHDGLLERLTSGVAGHAEVSVTGCLLACERSDVVVVSPGVGGRRAGGRPVWFAEVLDVDAVDAISAWVVRGGPGVAALPPHLRARVMAAPALADGVLDETMLR